MIEIFENYFVTEDGQIWSDKSHSYLAQRIGKQGYYLVNLSINGKCRTYQVHRLVAKAYLDNPDNLPAINHKDGNKLNNNVDNLEWCTQQHNVHHALENNLTHPAKGMATKNGRFTEDTIKTIRLLGKQGLSQRKIAAQYNITRSAIKQILDGTTYKWVI